MLTSIILLDRQTSVWEGDEKGRQAGATRKALGRGELLPRSVGG